MGRRDKDWPKAELSRGMAGLLLPIALVACDPGSGGDAGADLHDAGVDSARSSSANIPWLEEGVPPMAAPMLTPCPAGWHEWVVEGPDMDVVTCEPFGETPGGTLGDACPDGWAHFVGDAGCTPVGVPCPLGEFPEGLPADAPVLYVLASASPGGDGSEASPLSTITGALNLASPGTVIAIGKGEYDEALRLLRGVTLWGACAAETRVTASSWGPLAQGVITVPAEDTHLANLKIGPANLPGVVAYGAGASVSVDGLIIDGVRTAGVLVTHGARVSGRELVVSRTRANDVGRFGQGIEAFNAHVDLTRVLLLENRFIGVLASEADTTLTLTDVAIHDTRGQESDGRAGRGLGVQGGATATVSRALVSRSHDVGVFASGEATSLALSDVVITDTQSRQSDRTAGRGLVAFEGATVTVSRGRISGNREAGVVLEEAGTSMMLSDVVVDGTQAQESDGLGGRGLNVQSGATVTALRSLFSRNRAAAIFVHGMGTSLALSEAVVRDTEGRESDGSLGRGVIVQEGGRAEMTQVVFSRNRDVAVFAMDVGTSLTLTDVAVRETQSNESEGRRGLGLSVQPGSTVEATRLLVSRSRQCGVSAVGAGAALRLSDVVVTQTLEQDCVSTSCPDLPFGLGLMGTDGASLVATRFDVRDAALCGVMVANGGQVDLAVGEVSGSEIGVCLQVDGYSVSRLTDRVRYVGNGTNLDVTNLPVPEPVNSVM